MLRTARILPPLALLAAVLLPMPEAAAQFRSGGAGSTRAPAAAEPTRPPPAALPGLQYRRAPDPIPADPTQNLAPNAALFDAINRGDLPAAREAVGRGADIEARNVLGLTPVDAAVDQGRNEIMFFLLSVRAGSSRGGPPPAAEPAAPAPATPNRRAAAARPAPASQAERALPSGPIPQAPNARLWAGDGGAPQPEIGFLGFDAGRPDGAVAPTPIPASRPTRAGRG